MINIGEFYVIHDMKKRGMSITQIANELGRDQPFPSGLVNQNPKLIKDDPHVRVS